jgi:hypothetical protein
MKWDLVHLFLQLNNSQCYDFIDRNQTIRHQPHIIMIYIESGLKDPHYTTSDLMFPLICSNIKPNPYDMIRLIFVLLQLN